MLRIIFTVLSVLSFLEPMNSLRVRRIIGGEEINDIWAAPSLVSISSNDGKLMCGAAIVTQEWAVSSMECLSLQGTTLDKVSAKARSGSINYNTNGTVHDIVKVVVNPRGRLGIFKVSPNFQFSNQVTSAYLPDAADDVKYKFGIAYGWGKTESDTNAKLSDTLQITVLTYLDLETCRERSVQSLDENFVCYDGSSDNRNTCQGDLGGPVFNYKLQLIAVINSGYCNNNIPVIGIDVRNEVDWILENIH